MAELTAQQQKEIIDALEKRGAKLPCPRCGNGSFTLIGGYFNQTLQSDLSAFAIGGPSIPSAVVACTKCGFIAQHALGVLGLLPVQVKPQQEEKSK